MLFRRETRGNWIEISEVEQLPGNHANASLIESQSDCHWACGVLISSFNGNTVQFSRWGRFLTCRRCRRNYENGGIRSWSVGRLQTCPTCLLRTLNGIECKPRWKAVYQTLTHGAIQAARVGAGRGEGGYILCRSRRPRISAASVRW